MIKDKTNKLIVIGFILIFMVGLFFSIRFLKEKISQATNPSKKVEDQGALNLEAWEKIEHRFK